VKSGILQKTQVLFGMLVPLIFFLKRLLFPSSRGGPPQPWVPSPPPAPPRKDLRQVILMEHFLKEFNPEERRYFSRLVRECIQERNYPRGEDLYQYCYFSTPKYRMERLWRGQKRPSSLGIYLYAQSMKELESSIDHYQRILERGGISSTTGGTPSSWLEERMKEISSPSPAPLARK
jgi:hypothetical protein